MKNANCKTGRGQSWRYLTPPTAYRLPPTARGFTLVELLVAITVLAILASLILVGLANANASARDAKTRATIAKIDALVMAKYESYRTRRVPITKGPSESRSAFATRRLNGLRELMRLEMPERWSDIFDIPPSTPLSVLANVPAVTQGYRNVLASKGFGTSVPTTGFVSAKCLFLIVTRGCDEPDVMEQFAPNEIGTDEDGLNYFLDGWGRPISFLRWAPGFSSSLQPWDMSASIYPKDHDPFDPLKIHKPASGEPFQPAGVHPPLYPLIYSAGADGESEIVFDDENSPWRYSEAIPKNSPYAPAVGAEKSLFGRKNGPEAEDNITNHDGI